MKLKLRPSDVIFSQYIRKRDKACCRCGSPVSFNQNALPVSHQASHFFGRAREATRFEPNNVDTLCHGCHQYWGSTDHEAYRAFKIKQLRQKGFDSLTLQANTYKKRDDEMDKLYAKSLLESLMVVEAK